MMKTIKTGLLATAALAIVSTVAHADALADLKSVIAALNTRDAVSQTAVQIPRGYQVSPTADSAAADAPATVEEAFTEVKTSGYIKAGAIYSDIKDGSPADVSKDIDIEAGVNVKGSVQSSLGEVGATIQVKWDIAESTNNAATIALRDEGFVGFWQFADTFKLEMGRSNYGRIENGIDKNTKRLWTFANRRVRQENAGNGFFDRDAYNGFFGIAYASGPIAFNVRVHDATRGVSGALGSDDDAVGISAKAVYAGEQISFDAAGGYWDEDNASNLAIASQTGVKWLAGVGTEINVIEGVSISLGAQTGQLHSGANMVNASGSVGITLSDTVNLGIGGGFKTVSDSPTLTDNRTEKAAVAGIYYSPLAQMVIGLEGDYLDDGKPAATKNDGFTGALVTRYAF